MNPLNNNEIDYSMFGGTPIEGDDELEKPSFKGLPQQSQVTPTNQISQAPIQQPIQESQPTEEIDYSMFGGTPIEEKQEKPKVGKLKSALYGAAEGILGIPALIQYGVNELSKPFESMVYGDDGPKQTYEQENPIGAFLQGLPESEDQTSRRIRTGVAGGVAGLPFGIPGILAGLVGSQAGQTIREVYGKEGKFDELGLGEAAALGADVLAGGLTGAGASLARSGTRGAQQAGQRAPAIFERGENMLQRAVIKNTIQGEKNELQNIINNFSQQQVRGFEEQASGLSQNRFTELVDSSSSALKRHADNMFREGQLSTISPLQVTKEQGGRALQESANAVFQSNVLNAERQAYIQAREAAANLTGSAPRTIQEAKDLRAQLLRNNPTPEQDPIIGFLNNLIDDLETPASRSLILDAQGRQIQASASATTRPANDLVGLVQNANQAVNYGSELRQQSHRLIPLLRTLRGEVGEVLNQNPTAANLYSQANTLHATNAETWGTRFMRDLRFTENPERMVGKLRLSSNMRNMKNGIPDPAMQALGERLVIQNITEGGASDANRLAVNNLAPELSRNARNAAEQLVNVKDPLTSSGGRAAVRNQILKDSAQAVNTGKRPEQILNLMQTPKGLQIVRETLNGTPQSREVLRSVERLFVEDIFSSITDGSGMIDFKKARSIFKNQDIHNVVEEIGGGNLVRRFTQLETFANNLERNIGLYKTPEAQSLFQKIIKNSKKAGTAGVLLHLLHMPMEVIAGLGITKAAYEAAKTVGSATQRKILSSPRAVRALESISLANSTQELSKQLPRLMSEIDKTLETD